MSDLCKELVFLLLQFLEEGNFKEAQHKLEQESGLYFNLKYFEEKIWNGEWDELEKYMSGFTKFNDNRFSLKIMFEISKQKYLEALDRNDKAEAVEILVKDLRRYAAYNGEIYKDLTQLITLRNFRENAHLSHYGDLRLVRNKMVLELGKLVKANPLLKDKLIFPTIRASRLQTMINQSINWQHQQCKDPLPQPECKTLFADHYCQRFLTGPVSLANFTQPIPAHESPAPPIPIVEGAVAPYQAPGGATSLKRSRTTLETAGGVGPSNTGFTAIDRMAEELQHVQSNLEGTSQTSRQHQTSWLEENLPRNVAYSLRQGSSVTSMDFHPYQHTLLLVGASNGEFSLWELGIRQRVAWEPFGIWDTTARSMAFQSKHADEFASISVSRVTWSPHGKIFGVAFTTNLVRLYAHSGVHDISRYLEVDAHNGRVNDLAFDYQNKELCFITCGDDKLIKVWDLTGQNLYNFVGHEAPVYSVCPHQNKNLQFIFSTSIDGKIKTWMYDSAGPRSSCDAPGNWCTALIFSLDGSRMFSCGTSTKGDTFLVEWSENDGIVHEGAKTRIYSGFSKQSVGFPHIDVMKNNFLAVGEDSQIKYWHMDRDDVLTSTNAGGGLPNRPLLKFNKEGSLLAVTTTDDGFMILANGVGRLRVHGSTASYPTVAGPPTESAANKATDTSSGVIANEDNYKSKRGSPARSITSQNEANTKSRGSGRSKPWQLTEIRDPVKCRLGVMPGTDSSCKVIRLLYTSNGVAILALGSNGVQKLWKWPRCTRSRKMSKASARVVPQLASGENGPDMANDVSGVNLEEAVPCIKITNNASYAVSVYGGRIRIFNLGNLTVVSTLMELPPAPTEIAFHPRDNNIIAIGMHDYTIQIVYIRVYEVSAILKFHKTQITSLVFSLHLGILVSADAEGQICVWTLDAWERKKSIALHDGSTWMEFHHNQVQLLVFQSTQLAVFDAVKMTRLQQWLPQGTLSAAIRHATYSFRSKLVYTAFSNGNIGIFQADSLMLRCIIAPSAYLPEADLQLRGSDEVRLLALAANPQVLNQLAIGLSDGTVKVIEPSDGGWGSSPPRDDEASSSTAVNKGLSEQVQG